MSIAISKNTSLNFADLFPLIPKGSKTVSSYIEVIKITTDKKSLANSKKILKDLQAIIKDLPSNESELVINELELCLQTVQKNQLSINSMFDTIDNLFDTHNNATIDSPQMMEFLNNMTKAKELLSYISDYITLVFEVKNAKESQGKNIFTLEQFKNKFSTPEVAA